MNDLAIKCFIQKVFLLYCGMLENEQKYHRNNPTVEDQRNRQNQENKKEKNVQHKLQH